MVDMGSWLLMMVGFWWLITLSKVDTGFNSWSLRAVENGSKLLMGLDNAWSPPSLIDDGYTSQQLYLCMQVFADNPKTTVLDGSVQVWDTFQTEMQPPWLLPWIPFVGLPHGTILWILNLCQSIRWLALSQLQMPSIVCIRANHVYYQQ